MFLEFQGLEQGVDGIPILLLELPQGQVPRHPRTEVFVQGHKAVEILLFPGVGQGNLGHHGTQGAGEIHSEPQAREQATDGCFPVG